jgi:hypothetical protein
MAGIVMARLVPAIHDFADVASQSRGWPAFEGDDGGALSWNWY